jgi:hypothetical protein
MDILKTGKLSFIDEKRANTLNINIFAKKSYPIEFRIINKFTFVTL